MSSPQKSPVERVRAVVAQSVTCSLDELHAAIGNLVVIEAAQAPAGLALGEADRSVFDPASRTTMLLADRIPEGEEAQVLAAELLRHHGQDAAVAVMGEAVKTAEQNRLKVQGSWVVRTADLTGLAFDWAVAAASGRVVTGDYVYRDFHGAGLHEYSITAPLAYSPSRDPRTLEIAEAKAGVSVKVLLSEKFGDELEVPLWVKKLHFDQLAIDERRASLLRTRRELSQPGSTLLNAQLHGAPSRRKVEIEAVMTSQDGESVADCKVPKLVHEVGSDDTFWNSQVVHDGERFNVRVYDADGDRRPDREGSLADKALAVVLADRSVMRFSGRLVPAVCAIEALALRCLADDGTESAGRFAVLVGMSPDRFAAEVEGGHSRKLVEKLAARFSDPVGVSLMNELNEWAATERPPAKSSLNVKQMTNSALERFVAAVDRVMESDYLSSKERMELIGQWAYQFARPDMPEQLDLAIQRCQSNDEVHPTASSIVNNVTGEVESYSPPSY